MAGPLLGLLGQAGGAMFGTQVGQALGGLAGEVLSASDIGLPARPRRHGRAAARPTSRAFADGLDVSADDVLLYLALREAAHQRLFAHVPWLRGHLLAAVEDYGRGTTIDMSARSSRRCATSTRRNPASIQEALEGGLFEPEKTPAQQAALTRLETTLALVEGWVDEVVGQATETRMPQRRQAAGGGPPPPGRRRARGADVRRAGRPRAAAAPAARRLGAVGLAALPQGPGGPRRVWSHPDLLPTAADLDDPLGFQRGHGAGVGGALRRRVRRRAGRAARPSAGRPGRARHRSDRAARRRAGDAAGLGRARPRPGAAAPGVRRPPRARTRTALERDCHPAHVTAGALVLSADRTAGAAHPARQGPAVVPPRRSLRARDATLAGGGAAGGRRGVRRRRTWSLDPEPLHLDAHAVAFCGRARAGRHLDVRFLALAPAGAAPAVSEESIDVRWWPVDELPTDEPDMRRLVAGRSPGLRRRRRPSERRPRREQSGGSASMPSWEAAATPSRKPLARSALG